MRKIILAPLRWQHPMRIFIEMQFPHLDAHDLVQAAPEQQQQLQHLSHVFIKTLEGVPKPPELVVPIPMHWLTRLFRGTSAAETLSRSLAATISLPFAGDLLRCRRLLKKQSTLLGAERRLNVKDAYAASRSYDISGARILLVDDVITTGATCDSAARVLLKAGAATVYAVSVACGTGTRT